MGFQCHSHYVLSAMPVIVPVDAGRMAGYNGVATDESIYCRNRLISATPYDVPANHAIIVVGAHVGDRA